MESEQRARDDLQRYSGWSGHEHPQREHDGHRGWKHTHRAARSRAGLARALADGEFVAHLQPQVELGTGRVVAAEALARWQRPGEGVLPPAAFLPLIEDSGLMAPLTEVVLDDALRWCARHGADESEPLGVAVNVSAACLDMDLVARIGQALERWQVPARRLTVEITETAIMQDTSGAIEALGCLKTLGVQLAIDDFGTGHSSLGRVHRLPVDEIKIDRTFIRDMHQGGDRSMVRAIAGLGRNLGLRVVAEGVEHESELTLLPAVGCDLAQGFFISPPLGPAAFESWLAGWRRQTGGSPSVAQDAIAHDTLEATVERLLATTTSAVRRLNSAGPREIPGLLCAATHQVTEADAVLLWQPGEDAGTLIASAVSGVPPGQLRLSLTNEASVAGAVFHSRRPAFIADVPSHALPSKRIAAAVGAAAVLCQPICRADTMLGVLAIIWRQPFRPSAAVRAAVELLAHSVAPVMSP